MTRITCYLLAVVLWISLAQSSPKPNGYRGRCMDWDYSGFPPEASKFCSIYLHYPKTTTSTVKVTSTSFSTTTTTRPDSTTTTTATSFTTSTGTITATTVAPNPTLTSTVTTTTTTTTTLSELTPLAKLRGRSYNSAQISSACSCLVTPTTTTIYTTITTTTKAKTTATVGPTSTKTVTKSTTATTSVVSTITTTLPPTSTLTTTTTTTQTVTTTVTPVPVLRCDVHSQSTEDSYNFIIAQRLGAGSRDNCLGLCLENSDCLSSAYDPPAGGLPDICTQYSVPANQIVASPDSTVARSISDKLCP